MDTAYKAADTALETAYKAADTALGQRIDGIDTAYKAADQTLQSNIDKKADTTALEGVAARVSAIETDYLKAADTYVFYCGTASDVI